VHFSNGESSLRALGGVASVASGVLLVALVRMQCFGRALPLAALAKAPDLDHGLRYALLGGVQTALAALVIAPLAWKRSPRAFVYALAGALHLGAVALAGGDWMAFYRLIVPILPSFVLGAAELASASRPLAWWLRLAFVAALHAYFGAAWAPRARGVGEQRAQLIETARPLLAGAKSVAALDIGWVGAASSASIFDFAGITDEAIAVLPGGHTSKRIDDALFRARDPEFVILLADRRGEYARAVEQRVARLPAFSGYEPVAELPLGGTEQRYVVFRRAP
jgi:hypothetical protein